MHRREHDVLPQALEPDRGAELLGQREEIPMRAAAPDVVARDDDGLRLPRSSSAMAVTPAGSGPASR
jgi:hypothetical protein